MGSKRFLSDASLRPYSDANCPRCVTRSSAIPGSPPPGLERHACYCASTILIIRSLCFSNIESPLRSAPFVQSSSPRCLCVGSSLQDNAGTQATRLLVREHNTVLIRVPLLLHRSHSSLNFSVIIVSATLLARRFVPAGHRWDSSGSLATARN